MILDLDFDTLDKRLKSIRAQIQRLESLADPDSFSIEAIELLKTKESSLAKRLGLMKGKNHGSKKPKSYKLPELR
jgi:hypothetical protein